jgi:hypothetical protein
MDIVTLIGLGVAAVVLAFWVQRARRRSEVKEQIRPRSEVDAWIEEAVARALGERIAFGYEPLLEALRGDPAPDAVTAIEDAVRHVKLTYAKLVEGGDIEVRAEIAFEDGTSAAATRRFTEGKLPEAIREEFLRTGGAQVLREWHFPWYGPERGWAS